MWFAGFGYRVATSSHNDFLALWFSETGRWSVQDCIPTLERGNDTTYIVYQLITGKVVCGWKST